MQTFAEQVRDRTTNGCNFAQDPACESKFGAELRGTAPVDLGYSATLYDAILLYAHAATKVMSQGGSLDDGRLVTAAVRSTPFISPITNITVVLDENGDRVESKMMMNYVVGANNVLRTERVGVYDSATKKYTPSERKVIWPGNSTKVPTDWARRWRNKPRKRSEMQDQNQDQDRPKIYREECLSTGRVCSLPNEG